MRVNRKNSEWGIMKSKMMMSAEMEKEFEWMKWCNEIPFIKWPADWEVKPIPPFAGAVIRYWINTPRGKISVYLDCYENLGYFGEPHWEVYPDKAGENSRFKMADIEGLLKCIGGTNE